MSEHVTSGCPSPARMEKTNSSSSQGSESSLHLDFDSFVMSETSNCEGKVRPSSWDESDNDSSPEPERSSEPSQPYSNDSRKFKGSVAAEIKELKKQFFESLQKIKGANYLPVEETTNKTEIKSEDRRQCPARIKRRTKSSSSLSPVLEVKNQNSPEKLREPDEVFNEVSSKIFELDQKFYLNNFFNELRMKRISLIDPPILEKKTEEEETNQDVESIPIYNHLYNQELKENDAYFCKTARKLSQIIEVEENKKDLEKSSEETLGNSHLFLKSLKNSENTSPLQTARSRSEKVPENFKSLSSDDFEDFQKLQTPIQGSLSERSSKYFNEKPSDNYSFLFPKSAKESSKSYEDNNKRTYKFVCFNSQSETNNTFPQESTSKGNEKDNNMNSLDCLKIDLTKNPTSESPTPKTTDRSELNQSKRSDKSRNSNTKSPKFEVRIDRDSARSLRLEDMNTPDSLRKESEIEFRSRTASIEDFSPTKSRRSLGRSDNSFEPKSDRNFQIPLESSSLESVKSTSCSSKEPNSSKSQKPKSTGRLQRKKEKLRKNSACLELIKSKESHSFLERKSLNSSRTGFRNQENKKVGMSKESKTPNLKSKRSLKSQKTAEERFYAHSSDPEISSNNEILELDLPLDISESQKSSYRSPKIGEINRATNNSSHSGAITFKISRKSSENSSSSRSKNTDSTRSSPKITARTNHSNRSKEGVKNHDETENAWTELKKINDVLSNRTSVGSDSRKSSWRESRKTSLEDHSRKRMLNPDSDDSVTSGSDSSKNVDSLEDRLASGGNSRRSLDSYVIQSAPNRSPNKLRNAKVSPSSHDFEETETTDVHADRKMINAEGRNKNNSNKATNFAEDEEIKQTYSPRRLKSESESSDKRLSIINEVSFEDLEISNDSNDNENNTKEHLRRASRRERRGISPQSISSKNTPTPGRSSQKPTLKDESPHQNDLNINGEKWNELIETFHESPNSSFILENTFSDSPHKKENAWDSVKEVIFTRSENAENQNTGHSVRVTGNKFDLLQRHMSFENEMEEKEEDSKNPNLDYENRLMGKSIKKDVRSFQNFQNLYYFNVNEEKPFGIGECGDVTIWNTDKIDTQEKPKGHGDGIQSQFTPDILAILRRREAKTQRQLWTDLKEDFRNVNQNSNKLCTELEGYTYLKAVIPVGLKMSKSDNCVFRKGGGENNCQVSEFCEFKNTNDSLFESFGDGKLKSKNTSEHLFSTDSLNYEKEDAENLELEFERTPRLSRSMIDLNTKLEKDIFEDVELNPNLNSSRSQLFERVSATSKEEKETTNLNIFLARNQKEDKAIVKLNNWLNFKALEMDKTPKKDKKNKKKSKTPKSPNEQYQDYLCTGRSSVRHLKLRNPNCFQNFYKRIVSVFCLTSHSSAATSK